MTGPPRADLADRVALVTGATDGIGLRTAQRLAARGATVFVTGRDSRRGADAAAALRRAAGHDRVDFIRADHSTVAANRELAGELRERVRQLDVLVNNVGGLQPIRKTTGDGCELSLALNFVAPFVLTESLLPLLLVSRSGRCVNVISSSFSMAPADPFGDVQSEREYVALKVLARAKLFALVWTAALMEEYAGRALTFVTVNPGMAWTPGTQLMTPDSVPAWRYIWPVVRFFQRRADPDRAAAACEATVDLPPGELKGRYFDGLKPHPLPDRVLEPGLRERVLQLGRDLGGAREAR